MSSGKVSGLDFPLVCWSLLRSEVGTSHGKAYKPFVVVAP